VSPRARRLVVAGLIAGGGVGLFISLFLVWRQTGNVLTLSGASDRLGGRFIAGTAPSAWTAYPVASALLAVLAVGLVAAAFLTRRAIRVAAAAGAIAGSVFAAQAVTGALGVGGGHEPIGGSGPLPARLLALARNGWSGPGEKLAIAALVVALLGLAAGLVPTPGRHARRRPYNPAL
jgi:hypothetical protein